MRCPRGTGLGEMRRFLLILFLVLSDGSKRIPTQKLREKVKKGESLRAETARRAGVRISRRKIAD
jgi:hypothetical protein